jgi:uncharacterized ferritin-like protein (DUF455 family)
MDLRARALLALQIADPAAKVQAVRALAASAPACDAHAVLSAGDVLPGRPARPQLGAPSALARRSAFTPGGRAALLHAVAHIEFNAINLALDAVWRFAGMPGDYYSDWLRVAAEEAQHFTLLRDHLATLDCRYGDFPAHDGLWEMVEKTKADVLARMALVPRTLEARGLDASPPIRARLAQAGDSAAAAVIDIILRDEIGHVAIGNRWYRWLCAERGLEPLASYADLARRYEAPRPRAPFNLEARRQAGFTEAELDVLQCDSGAPPQQRGPATSPRR